MLYPLLGRLLSTYHFGLVLLFLTSSCGTTYIAGSSNKPDDTSSQELGGDEVGANGEGGSGDAGGELPAGGFLTTSCGEGNRADVSGSTDIANPSPLKPGTFVKGRVSSKGDDDVKHHFTVTLDPGRYFFIHEALEPNDHDNIGLEIEFLEEDGDERLVGRSNEITRRTRGVTTLDLARRTSGTIRISSRFDIADYSFGVYSSNQPIPVPYFDDCPRVIDLTLGEQYREEIQSDRVTPDNRVFFRAKLEPGDYKVYLGAATLDGDRDNLIGAIHKTPLYNDLVTAERLVGLNKIDVEYEQAEEHAVAKPQEVWLVMESLNDTRNFTIKLERE